MEQATPPAARRALARAAAERQRADRAADVAGRYKELRDGASAALNDFYQRMIGLHLDLAERHRTAAELHSRYAAHLIQRAEPAAGRRASFMAAIAEVTRSDEAAVTMFGDSRIEAASAASGPLSRAALDLELLLGEGPSHDMAAGRRPVFAVGSAILTQWPSFGTAIRPLGIQIVAAAPLAVTSGSFGSLAVFNTWSADRGTVLTHLSTVADALTHRVIVTAPESCDGDGVPLLEEADYHQELFRAAGRVMVQFQCSLADALALIRARAFALGLTVAVVAARILGGELHLNDVA